MWKHYLSVPPSGSTIDEISDVENLDTNTLAASSAAGISQQGTLAGSPTAGIPQQGTLAGLSAAGIPQEGTLAGLSTAGIPQQETLAGLSAAGIPQQGRLAGSSAAGIPQQGRLAGSSTAVGGEEGVLSRKGMLRCQGSGQCEFFALHNMLEGPFCFWPPGLGGCYKVRWYRGVQPDLQCHD